MAGKKSRIYYARTYRKLKSGGWKGVLVVGILVIPALFLLLWNCFEITRGMSWLAVKLLCDRFRGLQIQIVDSEFPIIGKISIVELPTVYPKLKEVIINLLIVMGMVIFACTGKRKGKPAAIFSIYGLPIFRFIYAAADWNLDIFYRIGRGDDWIYGKQRTACQANSLLGNRALFCSFWRGAICFFPVYP